MSSMLQPIHHRVMQRFRKMALPLAVCLCMLLTGCEGDDGCDGNAIALESLESLYGCSNTEMGLILDLDNSFTIISSQAEYDAQVEGFCQPEIDFSVYDLIIGRQTLTNGLESIDYSLRRACPTKRYEFRVVFKLDDTTVSPTVTYHVLAPRIAADEVVDVRVEFQ